MDTYSHELLDARMGAMSQGELTLAADLQNIDQSLTVFDRAYFSAAFLLNWQSQGQDRHWLMRAKDNLRHEVIVQHDEHDCLVSMPVSPTARKTDPQWPSHWQARLMEVQQGGRKRRFIKLMRQMAAHVKVEPLRMGFHVANMAIIDLLRFAPLESAGTLPKRLQLLFDQAH